MKKNKLNILSLMLLLVFSTSCTKYLDVAPDERLEVSTIDDVEATIVASYQNSRGYRFTFWATDNATAAKNVYREHEVINDLYTWNREISVSTHQDSPDSFWLLSYNAISQANLALESLDKITVTEDNRAKYEALRGEALLVRAYNHFMLVNIFGKQYGATATSDLGVPYVTKLEDELIVNYDRATVDEVYSDVEKDMLEGISLLEKNVSSMNKNKYRFTTPTMYLFASRFYTFRNKDANDVTKAAEFSQKSIDAFGGTSVMRSWNEYATDNLGPVDVSQPEVGMVRKSATWLFIDFNYQMTNDIRDKQLSKNPMKYYTDYRLQINYKRPGDIFTPAFTGVAAPSDGGMTQPYNDIFPIVEAIFNKAESAIRSGDFAEAKSMLEVVGANSYEDYNPSDLSSNTLESFYKTSDEKEAWTRYLLFERRNMFLLRGMRWFDIRRYPNLITDVEHKMQDGSVIKLSEKNPDRNYQIPLIARNTGMKPNDVSTSAVVSTELIKHEN